MLVPCRYRPHEHVVQFYEDDAVLAEVVADYLQAGVAAGERLLVLLTASHLSAVLARLEASGLDTAAALASGQLVTRDAETMLQAIMRDGMPVEALFEQQLLADIEALAPRHTRAFGELVNLLCAEGNHAAAVRLEAFWHAACQRLPLTLLCSYAMAHFEAANEAFESICDHHSRVLPAESFHRLAPHLQGREVSRLQRQTLALRREHAARLQAETTLEAVQALCHDMLIALTERDRHDGLTHRPSTEPDTPSLALPPAVRPGLLCDKLELHYRPLICAQGGQLVAISVAPCWRARRDAALTPPRRDAAEAAIGRWVLSDACRHACAWLEAGIALRVMVRVSRAELLGEGLVERVEKVLGESGLPGDLLELELGEGDLLAARRQAPVILERLRARGVRLTLDPLGSGQAFLEQFDICPFTTLRLHERFTLGCLDQPRHQASIQSVIAMAQALDLAVLASGVESGVQADYLRQQGCDILQGPLWSRMEHRDAPR